MAYTDKEWETVKSFYERGLTLKEIASRNDVAIKSFSQICKKAKLEGWEKEKEKKIFVEREIKTKRDFAEIIKIKENFSVQEVIVHETLVHEGLANLTYFNKAQKMLSDVSLARIAQTLDENGQPGPEFNMQELALASRVVKDSRDSIIGKAPETAIQINTGSDVDHDQRAIKAQSWIDGHLTKISTFDSKK